MRTELRISSLPYAGELTGRMADHYGNPSRPGYADGKVSRTELDRFVAAAAVVPGTYDLARDYNHVVVETAAARAGLDESRPEDLIIAGERQIDEQMSYSAIGWALKKTGEIAYGVVMAPVALYKLADFITGGWFRR